MRQQRLRDSEVYTTLDGDVIITVRVKKDFPRYKSTYSVRLQKIAGINISVKIITLPNRSKAKEELKNLLNKYKGWRVTATKKK